MDIPAFIEFAGVNEERLLINVKKIIGCLESGDGTLIYCGTEDPAYTSESYYTVREKLKSVFD